MPPKRSIFLTVLVPKLPAPEEEDTTARILESIDMDSYRVEKQATLTMAMMDSAHPTFAAGGQIADSGSSTGKGSFGFNARYTKTGGPKGQMVYTWQGTYQGQAADFILKSNALSSLSFSGGGSSYSATLQGKCSYTVVAAATGQQLYGEGNDTFIATVTDGDTGAGQQNSAKDSFSLTTFQGGNVKLHPISTTPLGGGNIVAHS